MNLKTTLRYHYWEPAKEWFQRVIYCHHNARVLADMEYRMSCVLCEATNGRMSKAYYDWPTMKAALRDAHSDTYNDGYADALSDHGIREPTHV